MKKTGCKAAILILLAVLVTGTQALAVRSGRGRGGRRNLEYGPEIMSRAIGRCEIRPKIWPVADLIHTLRKFLSTAAACIATSIR